MGCFTISVDLGFLRTCTLKCGYWQCHTSFLGESVTTKRKKSIDLAAQSGAANEVVSRYGSTSKEHLVSYSGVTRLKAHLCGILNLGRCVSVCFTVCLVGQNVRVEYYSLVFGKFRIVLTLSVVL